LTARHQEVAVKEERKELIMQVAGMTVSAVSRR
jgi:hypothetical protein